MKPDTSEIKLLELRIEYLKHMVKLWQQNTSVHNMATEMFHRKYKSVADHDDFIKALTQVHGTAQRQKKMVF